MAYILITVFTGFALGIVAYAVLWIFLPLEAPLGSEAGTVERPV